MKHAVGNFTKVAIHNCRDCTVQEAREGRSSGGPVSVRGRTHGAGGRIGTTSSLRWMMAMSL